MFFSSKLKPITVQAKQNIFKRPKLNAEKDFNFCQIFSSQKFKDFDFSCWFIWSPALNLFLFFCLFQYHRVPILAVWHFEYFYSSSSLLTLARHKHYTFHMSSTYKLLYSFNRTKVHGTKCFKNVGFCSELTLYICGIRLKCFTLEHFIEHLYHIPSWVKFGCNKPGILGVLASASACLPCYFTII